MFMTSGYKVYFDSIRVAGSASVKMSDKSETQTSSRTLTDSDDDEDA